MLKPVYQEMLRRLTLGDERAVGRVLCGGSVDAPLLDDKTTALVRLACLVAIESDGPSLHPVIDECHAAGAEGDEMLGRVVGGRTDGAGAAGECHAAVDVDRFDGPVVAVLDHHPAVGAQRPVVAAGHDFVTDSATPPSGPCSTSTDTSSKASTATSPAPSTHPPTLPVPTFCLLPARNRSSTSQQDSRNPLHHKGFRPWALLGSNQ